VNSRRIEKLEIALDVDGSVAIVRDLDFQVLIKHPHPAARLKSEDFFHRRIHNRANVKRHKQNPGSRYTVHEPGSR
jgi:hypothetical protein